MYLISKDRLHFKYLSICFSENVFQQSLKSHKGNSDVNEHNIGSNEKTGKDKINAHYRLHIRIIAEGAECKNEMSLEYQCSEYSLKSECNYACGFGTKDGSCHWLPENR